MNIVDNNTKHLGKKSAYIDQYTPTLLEPICRAAAREKLGLTYPLPFHGFDLWTAFELSWLNSRGKPIIGIAEFTLPANSHNIIESKSLKLYLNSLNQTRFDSTEQLQAILTADLSAATGAAVTVDLFVGMHNYPLSIESLPGILLDDLDIEISDYTFTPELLRDATTSDSPYVTETLSSNLLKSNCLVTYQPDWGSIVINYQGKQIDREKLLRYIISFRQHNEFHEQCVERIFTDIKKYCTVDKLTVFARYTRRGGIDINPFRSDFTDTVSVGRLLRQ